MSFGKQTPYRRSGGGPPAWLVFLIGIALVFGLYYLWTGVQNFLRTGGGGVVASTERAQLLATSTAQSVLPTQFFATATPIPACQDFVVTVPSANVRKSPSSDAPVLQVFKQDQTVCVLGKPDPNSEWYTINLNPDPISRRLELAYMNASVIEAIHPTSTPSRTPTPLPTVTGTPSPTRTPTPHPVPTQTPNPHATVTPTPSVTPSPTVARQSA